MKEKVTKLSFSKARNIILGGLFNQIILLPVVILYYRKLRKKNRFHLVICNHIGDFLVTMGYIDAFMKEREIDKLVIISDKKFQKIFNKYVKKPGIEYQTINPKYLEYFERCNMYRIGRTVYRYWGDMIVVAPGNEFMMDYDSILTLAEKYDFTLRECLAYCNLGLKGDALFCPLRFKSNKKNKKNSILLCEDARTIKLGNVAFYRVLKEKFESVGYCVDENRTEKSSHLIDFIEQCQQYQVIIGTRSGILDIASCCNVPIVAIYPKMNNGYMKFYDVNHMNGTDNCKQYMLSGNQDKDVEELFKLGEYLINRPFENK